MAGNRDAMSRWMVFMGNLVLQVLHTATGEQNTVASSLSEFRKHKRVEEEGLTGEAHRADVADVHDPFVAEASGSEVDLVLRGYGQYASLGRRRQERHLQRTHHLLRRNTYL